MTDGNLQLQHKRLFQKFESNILTSLRFLHFSFVQKNYENCLKKRTEGKL